MPDRILEMLIAERDKLQRAIDALTGARRRGRPPKAPSTAPASSERRRPRGMSAAARKRQSERMKAYWAARRKERKEEAKSK
jgi:hypothetical protein